VARLSNALLACLMLAAALAPAPARAAESYDNCVGFIDALPAVIDRQGTWCLRRDVSTAITSGAAVLISANNVTLDCNHFKIGGLAAGIGSDAWGIRADDRHNVTIRHCTVRGFMAGIVLQGNDASGHLVEDNLLDQNFTHGIYVAGQGGLVRGNRVLDTGGSSRYAFAYGISTLDADVVDNIVDRVHAPNIAYGIEALGTGSDVSGNRVRDVIGGWTGESRTIGISAPSPDMTIAGNRLRSVAVLPGVGILANGATSFCIDNTVAGFEVAMEGCERIRGNLSQ
jgi:hypothetical protein